MKWAPVLLAAVALSACDDMRKQRKPHPYRAPAGDPAPAVPGAVESNDAPAPPPPLTLALLQRGQAQYRAFCTPCHSELGDGRGMVVQRGFPPPPDYTTPRLLAAPTSHFFDVITNGHGAMYSFAQRVAPADRWAIAAYLRALQRSRPAAVSSPLGEGVATRQNQAVQPRASPSDPLPQPSPPPASATRE